MSTSSSTAAMAVLSCALAATAGAQPAAPVKNPFDRPRDIVALRAPSTVAAAPSPDFELRATLTGAERPLANIDGEILSLGASYFEYRVIAIAESRVVLLKDDERLVLELRADTAAWTR